MERKLSELKNAGYNFVAVGVSIIHSPRFLNYLMLFEDEITFQRYACVDKQHKTWKNVMF